MIDYHYFRNIVFDRAGKYAISVTAYMIKPDSALGINVQTALLWRELRKSAQVEEEVVKYVKTNWPEHQVHTIIARRYS